jgi:lipid A 3-O-deacylase
MIRSVAVALAIFFGMAAAGAADLYVDTADNLKNPVASAGWVEKYVSELRLGGLYHDPGIFGNRKEKGEDVNAEVLFASPDFLSPLWAPRPHLGTSINTVGYTSQVYGGLTWSFNLWRSLFFDLSEGGSLNNDTHLDKSSRHHKDLGSHLLFRESASPGWMFDDHNSLSIMLDHISNAGLAKYNGGMETVGLRYGCHF